MTATSRPSIGIPGAPGHLRRPDDSWVIGLLIVRDRARAVRCDGSPTTKPSARPSSEKSGPLRRRQAATAVLLELLEGRREVLEELGVVLGVLLRVLGEFLVRHQEQ